MSFGDTILLDRPEISLLFTSLPIFRDIPGVSGWGIKCNFTSGLLYGAIGAVAIGAVIY